EQTENFLFFSACSVISVCSVLSLRLGITRPRLNVDLPFCLFCTFCLLLLSTILSGNRLARERSRLIRGEAPPSDQFWSPYARADNKRAAPRPSRRPPPRRRSPGRLRSRRTTGSRGVASPRPTGPIRSGFRLRPVPSPA